MKLLVLYNGVIAMFGDIEETEDAFLMPGLITPKITIDCAWQLIEVSDSDVPEDFLSVRYVYQDGQFVLAPPLDIPQPPTVTE
jgi:hypothetical protein